MTDRHLIVISCERCNRTGRVGISEAERGVYWYNHTFLDPGFYALPKPGSRFNQYDFYCASCNDKLKNKAGGLWI